MSGIFSIRRVSMLASLASLASRSRASLPSRCFLSSSSIARLYHPFICPAPHPLVSTPQLSQEPGHLSGARSYRFLRRQLGYFLQGRKQCELHNRITLGGE